MATAPFVIVPSLVAIAVSYRQKNLIADNVLPRVPVMTESFRWTKYALGDSFKMPDTLVGRKSAPNQIEWVGTEASDTVQDQGLDALVPNKDILAWSMARQAGTGLAGPVDPLSRATELVTQAVQNRREYRAAGLVANPANYATANKATLSGTSQWSDFTASDPLGTIMTAMDSMVMRPTHAWCGRAVATKLRMHPKLCKAVFGNNTDAGIVPLRALADLLELEDIYVGDAYVDTAAPGQTANLARAWGKDFGLFYRNMSADTSGGVTFGMTAQWGDKVAGTIEDPDVGLRGGQRARSGESVKELITANDLGYLFKNAVA